MFDLLLLIIIINMLMLIILYVYIVFERDPAEGVPNKSYAVITAGSSIGKLRTVESKPPGKFL